LDGIVDLRLDGGKKVEVGKNVNDSVVDVRLSGVKKE